MGERVKRRYDNSRRQSQVRATRQLVTDAARQLFAERGYPATSIEAISEAADVPLATVYRLFGSKRAILAGVLDVAFGGDDEDIAVGDRPATRAMMAEPDPRRLLDACAHMIRALLDRSSALQYILASAAVVDADAAELLADVRRQRFTGQSRIVKALADRKALAKGLSASAAADIVYALYSPEVHRILTVERGWSPERYERWQADTTKALLLTPARGPTSPTRPTRVRSSSRT
jgi:AcrR family transcriptional regulator